MKLTRLALENWRNIPHALIEPEDGLNVLCGENGQGKTNLLEAVWMLTGAKSFRAAKDAEMIRRGADFAVLDGAASVMLTGETAAGQYPMQAMEYLVRTARTAM